MSDEEQRVIEGESGEPAEPAAKGPLAACCAAELTGDDLALVSQCAGVASLVLGMTWPRSWVSLVVLLLGAAAVYTGFVAQKTSERREKQAISGMICGTIGLCFWMLWAVAPQLLAWLHRH